jgi:hypothetical protein
MLPPFDDHGLTLVPDRNRVTAEAAPPAPFQPAAFHTPFRAYPHEVCVIIRLTLALSAAHRRLLDQATQVIAEHSDMRAQVDAAG